MLGNIRTNPLCKPPTGVTSPTCFSSSPLSTKRKTKMAASARSSSYSVYEVRRRSPNPKSGALLVIDMQNHFSSIARPILPALNTTISLCRAAGIPVIFTRHRHRSPADHAMLGEWWAGNLIIDGTPDAELLPSIDCRQGEGGDIVVEKQTYSAFRETEMEELLKGLGIEEVIITGVMTNLCCETSAREAFIRGFRVFFSTDATGTSNQDLHNSTLKNMAYGFAYLVDCDRLQKALSS